MTVTLPGGTERAARVVDVYAQNERSRPPKPSGRILLKPDTANVVRQVARHLHITMDELVQRMLVDWIPQNTDLDQEIVDNGKIK